MNLPPRVLFAFALLIASRLPATENLTVAPGFKVEELHHTDPKVEGSWVSLCVDDQSDLITSDQYGSLWRITPPALGQTQGAKVEKVKIKAGKAHGLMWAFHSLYFMGSIDPEGPGDNRSLYRAQSTKNDGVFDKVDELIHINIGGEHGPHGLALSPDGKHVVFNVGNHTIYQKYETARAPLVWQEDQLLPRMWDANGHARGILAPGGTICQCDPDGAHVELLSSGYRNEYDFAFDQNGELFTYDADMEWDLGLPWYRPTRICHATSGSDFGWRSGSGKWPAYYEDSLPAVVDIGPGSPTGVVFGTGAKFPAKYQRALFAMDWSFGTIYAIHLQPKGASYSAEKEVFIAGQSFPASDLVVRPQDGALYFTAGGRRTESSLYRVSYTGAEPTEPVAAAPLTDLQLLRRQLESHHRPNDPEAIAFAWPYLDSDDRFIRFAARTAIENQPLAQWQAKALAEIRPYALREVVIALARLTPDQALAPQLIERLLTQTFDKLDVPARLGWLRACSLVCIRLGLPDDATRTKLLTALDAAFPTIDPMVNRELGNLLIALKSPTIVPKEIDQMYNAKDRPEAGFTAEHLARGGAYGSTIEEMQKEPTHKQQIHFAFTLRAATEGWTAPLREKYFAWFNPARAWKGGNSFAGFLRNARDEALALVPEPLERERFRNNLLAAGDQPKELPRPAGPGANYTEADFAGVSLDQLRQRDVAHGKQMFQAALCAQCHRFGGEFGGSGAGGPDLTGAAARYTVADLVTSIVDPSKVISDQYAFTEFTSRKYDNPVLGRVAREDDKDLYLITSFLAPEALTPLQKGSILSQKLSKVSPMPPGLLNALNKDEALDLLGFLMTQPK